MTCADVMERVNGALVETWFSSLTSLLSVVATIIVIFFVVAHFCECIVLEMYSILVFKIQSETAFGQYILKFGWDQCHRHIWKRATFN